MGLRDFLNKHFGRPRMRIMVNVTKSGVGRNVWLSEAKRHSYFNVQAQDFSENKQYFPKVDTAISSIGVSIFSMVLYLSVIIYRIA